MRPRVTTLHELVDESAALDPDAEALVFADGGLTALGKFTVEQAMARGIILDPDHLSVKARKELLPIVEAKGYSGIMSSHSWSTVDAFPRIYKLGGFVAPYAGDTESFVKAWKTLKPMRDKRFKWGIGYGADMNGLGKQGHPRGADVPNRVQYPFKGLDPGVTVHQNKTGSRTWDIATDGTALRRRPPRLVSRIVDIASISPRRGVRGPSAACAIRPTRT